ncbi:MAG: SUMF1/EgtB/PvdO family nonheme iron enzyme [Chloroflexaceae bacterium]|nr:SUMF1/EgtB/PvdO family nonheme iron enzyme [Chloroflexaceae bacterium]
MTSDPHFGEWLQRVRKQYLYLTQEELATQLKYSRDTIHKIETGRRSPSKELAEALADLIAIDPSEREQFIKFARGHLCPTTPPDTWPPPPHLPPLANTPMPEVVPVSPTDIPPPVTEVQPIPPTGVLPPTAPAPSAALPTQMRGHTLRRSRVLIGMGLLLIVLVVGVVLAEWQQPAVDIALLPTQSGMVPVAAGIFLLGSTPQDIEEYMRLCRVYNAGCAAGNFDDELPQRSIYLDAFWIDAYEVTNAQFAAFVAATGYTTTAERAGQSEVLRDMRPGIGTESMAGASWRQPEGAGSDLSERGTEPVTHVSWDDAAAYCAWRDARLPTEAEWEKAARGTQGNRFPWGNEWQTGRTNSTIEIAPNIAPVGTYPTGVSPYEAHDMLGNVAEWVDDWYHPEYYRAAPERNPHNTDGQSLARSVRGGSWGTRAGFLHATWRSRADHTTTSNLLGFRCVRSP